MCRNPIQLSSLSYPLTAKKVIIFYETIQGQSEAGGTVPILRLRFAPSVNLGQSPLKKLTCQLKQNIAEFKISIKNRNSVKTSIQQQRSRRVYLRRQALIAGAN